MLHCGPTLSWQPRAQTYTLLADVQRNILKRYVLLAGTDDHLIWLSPVILNLESTGLTHLESEIRASEGVFPDLEKTIPITATTATKTTTTALLTLLYCTRHFF